MVPTDGDNTLSAKAKTGLSAGKQAVRKETTFFLAQVVLGGILSFREMRRVLWLS